MDRLEVNVQNLFPVLLTVLFIGLKLSDIIDWSWWWVLSPLWIPLAVVLGVAIVILIIAVIVRFAKFLVNN